METGGWMLAEYRSDGGPRPEFEAIWPLEEAAGSSLLRMLSRSARRHSEASASLRILGVAMCSRKL